MSLPSICLFFSHATATPEIYTLSLHDALPISDSRTRCRSRTPSRTHRSLATAHTRAAHRSRFRCARSEEHTSELQSLRHLVCRLLLEKKKGSPCSTIHSNTTGK